MDITSLFRACVKTIRLQNGNFTVPDKNRILKASSSKTHENFNVQSKDIRHKINLLRDFLIENRAAYLKFACHLKKSAQMSNEERDTIDQECEEIIVFCSRLISDLHQNIEVKLSAQVKEHQNIVLESLEDYLKSIHIMHIRQKNHRIQNEMETYKFIKLDTHKRISSVLNRSIMKKHEQRNLEQKDKNKENLKEKASFNDEIKRKKNVQNIKSTTKLSLDDEIATNQSSYEESDKLTTEDIQMFESENLQLYHELKGLTEEVEQIEKTVVDIAQLQEIFTEKVSLQKTDIERISNTVVGATENVKDANEQIKQSIQRNAGLRVWILFFLLVMSFSLLFLDWYND